MGRRGQNGMDQAGSAEESSTISKSSSWLRSPILGFSDLHHNFAGTYLSSPIENKCIRTPKEPPSLFLTITGYIMVQERHCTSTG